MIRPPSLSSSQPLAPGACRPADVWEVLSAAREGDVGAVQRLLEREPNLYRAEYWYTQPIHLAVREGRVDVVELLLDSGADPAARGLGDDLLTMARDRGHERIASLLVEARVRLARADPAESAETEVHAAAAADDVERLDQLLTADPGLVDRSDGRGGTPLHRAVVASARAAIALLLERGADIHALHGAGDGYSPVDFQPIDLALWDGPFWNVRADLETARLLVDRGATRDTVIAAALGDLDRVRQLLDQRPQRIAESRPCGKGALSTAVELGHDSIVSLLLERGADPNTREGGTAPRGVALHAAARGGRREIVEALLAHGADPNGCIDSSGSAAYVASTPEVRKVLLAHGARLDPYDLVWLNEDEEALRRVADDPDSASTGCGGVLAAACKMGKRDLLQRLLAAGVRLPPMLTECRSYLLTDPELLGLLLDSGMDPNLPNWQRATPLHDLCDRDGRGRPRPHRIDSAALLLEAGADLDAREEEYRSRPLAWAARNDLPDMVEWLLGRGSLASHPDDEPWATPLAWATRRGNEQCAELLRWAGAGSQEAEDR